MNTEYEPVIIQGGMGVAVSGWQLARAVSLTGQLGVVSGTAMDTVLLRRLQLGDPGGHMRRALAEFPFQEMADRILERYFIPGGKSPGVPFAASQRNAFSVRIVSRTRHTGLVQSGSGVRLRQLHPNGRLARSLHGAPRRRACEPRERRPAYVVASAMMLDPRCLLRR